jgi:hypothetical protein
MERSGKRGSRVALGLFGLLAIAAGFGAGFALGSGDAVDADEANAAQAEARQLADATTRAMAWSRSLGEGVDEGQVEGERSGLRAGSQNGRSEALDTLDASEVGVRSESRSDIGYEGSAGGELDGDGEVLVVGDSLTVGDGPYIQDYLADMKVTVSAKEGNSSPEVFALFQAAYDPAQSIVVFDAGTNDSPATPEILTTQLRAVADTIGDRCMVVPTVNGPTIAGVDSSGINRAIYAFAASRPGTQVPDWAGAVAENPSVVGPDGIHPGPDGYAYRAQLIGDAIQACGTFG